MAQLNTSLSDMPWFGQPADPGASLARGVASGAQIANVQNQRASLAQQKMEFDKLQELRQAQEERAAALFPLVKTLKQQEMTMKGLELQDVLEGRQSLIEDKQIVSRGRQVADEYLNQGDPLRAKSFILDMTVQTPRLRNNQAWQELMANIDAAVKLGQEQEKINALLMKAEGTGSRGTSAMQNFGMQQQLKAELDQATASGDTSRIERAKSALADFTGMTAKSGFQIDFDESGKIRSFSQGSVNQPKMPQTTIAQAESKAQSAVTASRLGMQLINNLKPEDLGILGKGGEMIVDSYMAQAIPGLANVKRVNKRELLRLYRNEMVRGLKQDSQMSEPERKELEAMAPSLDTDVALPKAIQQIKTASREIAIRARLAASRSGVPTPVELLMPDEVMQQIATGKLTPDQAKAIAINSPFQEEFDQLLKKSGIAK